tara:strand:- start:3613 stop:4044 length:432 start_codon:yes stop_codon:yes gene_type:complete
MAKVYIQKSNKGIIAVGITADEITAMDTKYGPYVCYTSTTINDDDAYDLKYVKKQVDESAIDLDDLPNSISFINEQTSWTKEHYEGFGHYWTDWSKKVPVEDKVKVQTHILNDIDNITFPQSKSPMQYLHDKGQAVSGEFKNY